MLVVSRVHRYLPEGPGWEPQGPHGLKRVSLPVTRPLPPCSSKLLLKMGRVYSLAVVVDQGSCWDEFILQTNHHAPETTGTSSRC